MSATISIDQSFVNPPTTVPTDKLTRRKGWQRVQRLAQRAQQRIESFERRQLDPLFDRALAWWGDPRSEQHRQVRKTTLLEQLSEGSSDEEHQINHGFHGFLIKRERHEENRKNR